MSVQVIQPKDVHNFATQLILGAKTSIDFRVNVNFVNNHADSRLREDLLALANDQLSLRIIYDVPDEQEGFYPHYYGALRCQNIIFANKAAFREIRFNKQFAPENLIIVDSKTVLLSVPTNFSGRSLRANQRKTV